MAYILLKICTKLDGHINTMVLDIVTGQIKTTTLLELSLKVLSIKFEWGATSKKFASILLRN